MFIIDRFKIKILNRFKHFLRSHLIWNTSLRLFYSQFTPLLMSSLLNVYNIRFDTRLYKVSSILSILTLIGIIIMIAAILILFKKIVEDRNFTESSSFESRFGVLTEGIKTNVTSKRSLILPQKGFYLGRWIITIGVMIFLRE